MIHWKNIGKIHRSDIALSGALQTAMRRPEKGRRRRGSLHFLLLVLVIQGSLLLCEEARAQNDLLSLLPSSAELKGWQLEEPPQTAKGDDLFLLIDGGAELYLRMGFEKAVIATYKKASGKTVNLEIFEMKNPISAQETFKRKTSERGKPVPIGTDALLDDYYLNYWKGRFQVTLTGLDADQETIHSLLTIGKMVDERIQPE